MEAVLSDFVDAGEAHASAARCYDPLPDPLGADLSTDDIVVTTRRGMTRVALVATEVAHRFQRDGVAHDPMAWLLAPRRLFGGASAIDACVGREACMRGLLLHGLALGLDADPADVDELIDDGEFADRGGPDRDARAVAIERFVGPPGGGAPPRCVNAGDGDLQLFTATVVASDGRERIQAFHASLAHGHADVAARLYGRMGVAMADARIVEGFDPSDPLVNALVAPALCDTLSLIADDPSSPLAAGLDLNVEQRFLN